MIPCEECIVFAVCRFRREVYCNKLFYWGEERCGSPIHEGLLFDRFPNWKFIYMEWKPQLMSDYLERVHPDCYSYSVYKWIDS